MFAAAASGCLNREFIVALDLPCFHPLWVRFFQTLWVRSNQFFFTLLLVKAAGTSRCSRLSVTPCATFPLANCSLVCSMLTRVLRVVCWTDQSPCTSLSCSGPLHILQLTRASVWIRACFSCPALASGSRTRQSSLCRALQLRSRSFRRRCCGGHVPHGHWALLDSDTLALIDWSARLVEPCACDRRINRSSRSAHDLLRELHRGSLSLVPSRSSGTCLSLALRIFFCTWMIGSGFCHLLVCSLLCIPGHSLLSIHNTISRILMHLMQVHHRFSVFCGASRRCARASAAICSQEESYQRPRVLGQPLLSWQTPQELVFVVLRHSLSSPLLPPSLLSSFTQPDRSLPNGCVDPEFSSHFQLCLESFCR